MSPRAADAADFGMSNSSSLIWEISLFVSCRAHLQDSPGAAGVAVPAAGHLERRRVPGSAPASGGHSTNPWPSAPKKGDLLPEGKGSPHWQPAGGTGATEFLVDAEESKGFERFGRAPLGFLGSVFSFVHACGIRLSWNTSSEF